MMSIMAIVNVQLNARSILDVVGVGVGVGALSGWVHTTENNVIKQKPIDLSNA